MKRALTSLFFLGAVAALLFPHVTLSFANIGGLLGGPFGGKVISVRPCNSGELIYLKPAGSSPPVVMWQYGTLGYRYNLASQPRVNQYLLGKVGANADCYLGKFYQGSGPDIQFYGSSR